MDANGAIGRVRLLSRRNLEHDRALTPHYALGQTHVALSRFLQGDWESAVEAARMGLDIGVERSSAGHLPSRECVRWGARPALSLRAKPRSFAVGGRVNALGRWAFAVRAIEGLTVVGAREEAASLYPLAVEIAESFVMLGWGFSLLQKSAGIARRDVAGMMPSGTSRSLSSGRPTRFPIAPSRRRSADGTRPCLRSATSMEIARRRESLLADALPIYEDIGMPRHLELACAMLASG